MISAPRPLLLSVIAVISVVGSYGYNNSIVDVWVMFGFGLLGYILKKLDFPITPIILALVLGGILEENFRRALIVSNGDYAIFVSQAHQRVTAGAGSTVPYESVYTERGCPAPGPTISQ